MTGAKLNWNICTSCGMTYSTTAVGLFIQSGAGDLMDSGFYNYNFAGQPVKQKWSTKFQASKFSGSGYIQPVLTLLWTDSVSAKSGEFMLSESSTGTLLEEADLVEIVGLTSIEMEE
ncbi:hypothetical protein ACIQXF_11810 [Lysinibacillus sp. NPDC097231]|uniref:hypothetical protein n=1 Tax=Lysinibacillus sp. NPDC097231 TaxID=3364142 RepID=UPI003820DC80